MAATAQARTMRETGSPRLAALTTNASGLTVMRLRVATFSISGPDLRLLFAGDAGVRVERELLVLVRGQAEVSS